MSTFLQDLSDIGNFLAGLALPLAVGIFYRDRRAANRAQVDLLALWIEVDAELKRVPGQPHWVQVRALIRNASNLPIEITHVGVDIRPNWLVQDILQTDKRLEVYKGREAPTNSMTFGGFRLAPGVTHEQEHTIDVSGGAPAGSPMLMPGSALTTQFRTALVIDNAGRRWRLRPGERGPAQFVRRYRRKDVLEPPRA